MTPPTVASASSTPAPTASQGLLISDTAPANASTEDSPRPWARPPRQRLVDRQPLHSRPGVAGGATDNTQHRSLGEHDHAVPNLPAGRYAVVIQKITGSKDPITLTMVLQNDGGAWKLAGYYPRLNAIGGHDGQWYLTKAREYKRPINCMMPGSTI